MIRHVEEAMGTVFSFDIRGPLEPGALDAAVAWLHRVDDVFSPFKPQSQVSRLARGEVTLAQCDRDVADVLALCERAQGRSGGWFSVRYAGALDPTGLVKGWAVERAVRDLAAAGATAVCLNGGGDVQLYGGPWRVGISHPLHPGRLAAVVTASEGLAVATSGPAERGCHILDPRTGKPATSPFASMTVVAPSLTDADAWATAAYAMGPAARDWLESLPDVEAFAVTHHGTVWRTGGFDAFAA